MMLRTRLAVSFAVIALGTSAAVALAVPIVVGQGFQQLETQIRNESPSPGPSAQPTPAAQPSTTPLPTASPAANPTPPPTPRPSKRPSPTPSHDWNDPWDHWNDGGWSGSVDMSVADALTAERAQPATAVLAVAHVPVSDATRSSSGGSVTADAGPASSASPAGATTAAYTDIATDTILKVILIAVGAAFIASLLGLVVADRLVRPLRKLQEAAKSVATGELDARSGLAARTDEIGELARSFDAMAGALQASEVGRRRFLQDAVHELRTPLTVIEATASAVIDGVYALEPRHLETIRAQGRLLARVVDDLRTISLAESHALELRPEPIDAGAALRDAASGFGARAERDGIQIDLDAPETLVAEADPERLRQMLGALVDNAIRHTPAGGSIILAGTATDGVVRFDVRDSGPGVAPEDLPHVFERFYQADPSRDRARGSSGLGLAIVKALAEAHGGAVGVANAASGGADFWIEIPAA
ncbi:MAG: HAMP domain-containing sensor histidine kinase [Chloroflexi bacterium]|nr:HAMP domain-containing sensor histidine kinase [Chloroflexota bacterium]MDA8237937.1 HAMP domain-containing sensor histidine kinase [Chloroflexota bacterium]